VGSRRGRGSPEPKSSFDLIAGNVVVVDSGGREFTSILDVIGSVNETVELLGANDHPIDATPR